MTRLCVGLISYFCLAFLLAVAQPVSALAAANEQRLLISNYPDCPVRTSKVVLRPYESFVLHLTG